MHPYKIHIDILCQRDQFLCRELIDPHLRQFHKENIAGMNIHAEISSFQVLRQSTDQRLHHRAFIIPRKDPVHIQVKHRNPSGDRINSQRVQSRIYIYDPFQPFRLRLQPPKKLIADKLTFQFVSMSTGYHCDPLFFSCGVGGHDPVFPDPQAFIHRQFHCHHCFRHFLFPPPLHKFSVPAQPFHGSSPGLSHSLRSLFHGQV